MNRTGRTPKDLDLPLELLDLVNAFPVRNERLQLFKIHFCTLPSDTREGNVSGRTVLPEHRLDVRSHRSKFSVYSLTHFLGTTQSFSRILL